MELLRAEALHEAYQRGQVQAVAHPAHERRQAGERERRREGEADECSSEREDAGSEQPAERPAQSTCEDDAREHRSRAPGGHEQAVAAIAAVQGRLDVGDLDRAAGLHEHEGHGIDDQEGAQRGHGVDVRPGLAQAGANRAAPGFLDVRVHVEHQRAADHECADVDEQGRGRPRGGNHRAAQRRPGHERDREGDVQRGVRSAFSLACGGLGVAARAPVALGAAHLLVRIIARRTRDLGAQQRVSGE